ncbi:MAG: hypothetical protein ACT4QE_20610, partial [Anaerolineales bacterium]
GSGMHWQRASVNPMLALRNLVCNDRWPEAWPSIARRRRQHALARQHTRRTQRQQRLPALYTQTSSTAPAPQPPQPIARISLISG